MIENLNTSNNVKLNFNQQQELQNELGSLLREKNLLGQAIQKEKGNAQVFKEELFLELLELFDTIESLLNYLNENPEVNPQFAKRLPKTIGTIKKKLLVILARREVIPIDFQEGKPDFRYCQVVDREERSDLEEQTITKIVRQGFLLDDKILRPTEIITSKKVG